MAGSSSSAQPSESVALSLPPIGPVHSTPSKKASMRKKLSRIAFPFSSSEDPEQEFTENSFSVETPHLNDNLTVEESNISNTANAPPLNHKSSSSASLGSLMGTNGFMEQVKSKSIANGSNTLPKINRSTSSLVNSVGTPLNKLPYKSSATNLSSSSVAPSKQQSQTPMAIPIRRSESLTNSSNSSKPVNFHHASSPNKASNRYLATNNDHTFLLSRTSNNQQHSLLSAPQQSMQRPSHSQTNSINHLNDDSVLSSTNSSTNNSSNAPKLVPPTSLPQFTPVNQVHHPQNSTAVLVPPTVLNPVYKVPSTGTQGTAQQIYTSANNSSIMYPNHNNESSTQTAPSVSDNTSSTSRQKRGTGLLQNAYRSSHQSHSNLPNSKVKDGSTSAQSTTNSVANTNIKSNGIYSNDMICLDSKHHFISPKITNQFKSLQHLIQLGIKKRLEYLDNENSSLLSDINKYYDEIENVQKQLSSQVNDLDGFIATMISRKEIDIKNLQQHGLFENLNDLNARIETVKGNMDTKKESLKVFEAKLNTLAKLKRNNENRDRNRKHMASITCMILAFLFLLKLLIFR